MKTIHSDSESNLSTDSLEEPRENKKYIEIKCDTKINRHQSVTTIPFYRGDIPAQEFKKNSSSNIGNVTKSYHSSTDFSCDSQNSLSGSYFTYIPHRTVSARTDPCRQRPSRRRSISVVSNCVILKTRHRSVSYLEQFRKHNNGTHKTDSMMYSTVGSEDSETDKNLSFVSFTTSEQGRMNISELNFYEDIIKNSLSSSTQIQKDLDRSTPKKSSKVKQKGEKPVLLSKVDKLNQQEKKELDKRNALKKREAYANKVKLKNEIKIKRQKEKEKLIHFQQVHSSQKLQTNQTREESMMANLSDQICKNMVSVPFTEVTEPSSKTNPKKHAKQKCSVKKEDGCKRRNPIKKLEEATQLRILQQRHEREKGLVDSIKALIL